MRPFLKAEEWRAEFELPHFSWVRDRQLTLWPTLCYGCQQVSTHHPSAVCEYCRDTIPNLLERLVEARALMSPAERKVYCSHDSTVGDGCILEQLRIFKTMRGIRLKY